VSQPYDELTSLMAGVRISLANLAISDAENTNNNNNNTYTLST